MMTAAYITDIISWYAVNGNFEQLLPHDRQSTIYGDFWVCFFPYGFFSHKQVCMNYSAFLNLKSCILFLSLT